MPQAARRIPLNVLLVGATGTGKSKIVENLSGRKGLSHRGKASYTSTVTAYSASEFTIFDTPGFGDSQGRDGVFIQELVSNMKTLKDGLVLVVFCQVCDSRFDTQQLKTLAILNDIFQGKLETNLCICLTQADKDDEREMSRKETLDITQHKLPVCFSFKDDSSQVLEIMRQYVTRERLMTDYMVTVLTDEQKLADLGDKLKSAKSEEEKRKVELKMKEMEIRSLERERDESRAAMQTYTQSAENWGGVFTTIGRALDSACTIS